DPVSVFGVWRINQGWEGVKDAITTVARRFSDCTSYDFEVEIVDVRGELAYTVGYEPTSCYIDGVPDAYSLRVTNIYRRENGGWKLVHRHADRLADQTSS
ncbi:MAG: nuclear transport factor 2 family protein, partial [Sciscionella sp.]